MTTGLVARLRKEAAILAEIASHWGEYTAQSVRRGQDSKAGYEAAYAANRGGYALDLSEAADELERLSKELAGWLISHADPRTVTFTPVPGFTQPPGSPKCYWDNQTAVGCVACPSCGLSIVGPAGPLCAVRHQHYNAGGLQP